MTQEQKAKAYDKALEKAQNALKDGTITATTIAYLKDIFPELTESENDDEKIRIAILNHLKKMWGNSQDDICGVHVEDAIAWLEKQSGKEKPQVYKTKEDKVITYSESEGYKVVGPKFHEGDFIKHNKGNVIYKIISVNGDSYHVENIETGNRSELLNAEPNFHLWTIQDAKDGDVLCSHHSEVNYHWIGIFHKLNTNNTFDSHCYLPAREHGKFCPPSKKDIFGRKYVKNHLSTHMVPATKEQRGLLFQKMKEAGYEWDAEKKILNEIKNEIEIPFSAKDSELQEATYYIPKGFHAEIDRDKVVIKKDEILDKWSKDDERICQCLIRDQEKALDDVRNDKYGHSEIISDLKEMYRNRIDWLKSLKNKCISQKDI